MSGMKDHLRIVLREARATVAQMESERATTAAAAHYHVYQVAHRFLVAPDAFPTRPQWSPRGKEDAREEHEAVAAALSLNSTHESTPASADGVRGCSRVRGSAAGGEVVGDLGGVEVEHDQGEVGVPGLHGAGLDPGFVVG